MRWSIATILVAATACARAAELTSWESEPEALPEEAVAAIRRFAGYTFMDSDDTPCKFVGTRIALVVGSSRLEDWFVTAPFCSFTRAAGAETMWILRRTKRGYRVVLEDVTVSVTLGKSGRNGLRHIATARNYSSNWYVHLWKYDGRMYRVTRSGAVGYMAW